MEEPLQKGEKRVAKAALITAIAEGIVSEEEARASATLSDALIRRPKLT